MCLSTRVDRTSQTTSPGRRVVVVVAVQSIVTKVAGLPKLPFRETWRRVGGRGGACKGRKGAKDNREVGRQCSRQFPHVAFSRKTYFSSSSSSFASELRSSSGLRMASFREQRCLLTVFHARIFLPSFCPPPSSSSFFLFSFWNYRPLTLSS